MQAERDIRGRIGDQQLDFAAMAAVSNIYRAANVIRNHMERKVLADEDLSWAAFTVLFVLWIWGEQQTRDLAAEAGVTTGTLTGVLKTLEKRGLARRRGPRSGEGDEYPSGVRPDPRGGGRLRARRLLDRQQNRPRFGRSRQAGRGRHHRLDPHPAGRARAERRTDRAFVEARPRRRRSQRRRLARQEIFPRQCLRAWLRRPPRLPKTARR